MEQIHTAYKVKSRAKYQNDEEYKILRLLFGRVFIFVKKLSPGKKLGVFLVFTVSLLFALNIVGVGYNLYLGDKPIGSTASRHDGAAALAAAEKIAGGSMGADLKYYPRLVFLSRYSDAAALSENILLASGNFVRGAEIVTEDKHIVFSSEEEMREALDLYMKPYKTENTVNARLEGAHLSAGIYKKDETQDINGAIAALGGTIVVTTERVTDREIIERDTETVEDGSARIGQVSVVQEGSDGSREVSKLITKVNGEITKEYVIEENITAVPVARIEKVGTYIPDGEGSGSFALPVSGTVTSPFGNRWGKNHTGTDFGAPQGTQVLASDSGTVSFCGDSAGYGNLIIIDHKNGYETYYGHLSKISVSQGQKVKKGEKIGEVGSTGNSTGPHLHFEIRENSSPQNPLNYLDK